MVSWGFVTSAAAPALPWLVYSQGCACHADSIREMNASYHHHHHREAFIGAANNNHKMLLLTTTQRNGALFSTQLCLCTLLLLWVNILKMDTGQRVLLPGLITLIERIHIWLEGIIEYGRWIDHKFVAINAKSGCVRVFGWVRMRISIQES